MSRVKPKPFKAKAASATMNKYKLEQYDEQWGGLFKIAMPQLSRHLTMLALGGHQEDVGGKIGMGMEFHYREAIKLIWPDVVFHKWLDTFIHEYLTHRTIVVIGPASSGKSFGAAVCALMDYFIAPSKTTCVLTSDTLERLENRIWADVKNLHQKAQANHPNHMNIRGRLVASRHRIITNDVDEFSDDKDFKSGLVCVAAKLGTSSMASFVGFKNDHMRLFGDELSFLPASFVDSLSNLDKNADFKCVGLGNPKETTDALGRLAEPHPDIGGWDSGIDQSPNSKTWKIRRPEGVCVQYVGPDSPNLDGSLGIPLITQAAMNRDIADFGRDSWQFTMMNMGCMPRGQGSRRVVTRQECLQHGATGAPLWANTARTKIGHLDAAYGGVGGDRCVLMFSEFGYEMPPPTKDGTLNVSALLEQSDSARALRQLFHLQETMLVPIKNDKGSPSPCDQIAVFCMMECKKRGISPTNFFYDAGMRTALTQSFGRLWSALVNTIDFGGKPSERYMSQNNQIKAIDVYSKKVTELWFGVRLMIMADQMRGLNDDVITELAGREWKLVGANKQEVETKADMKKKMGRSPDMGDCLVVGAEGARQLGFTIKNVRAVEDDAEDDRWKRIARDRSRKMWGSGQLTGSSA